MASKKQWSDLTQRQRVLIVVGGLIEVVLTSMALRDLRSRSSAEVRGPKVLWVLACVVQPFGPVAYLVAGRRDRTAVVPTADG